MVKFSNLRVYSFEILSHPRLVSEVSSSRRTRAGLTNLLKVEVVLVAANEKVQKYSLFIVQTHNSIGIVVLTGLSAAKLF